MDSYYRSPDREESKHSIILQNRCGSRLSMLFNDTAGTELEFVYKPNAFRRKDFYARNFSNRDNFTLMFPRVLFPEVTAEMVTEWNYDPFTTVVKTEHSSQAKNTISFVNIADENCFALAARCPLLISIEPHMEFDVQNGLLSEAFTDRGEPVFSYVSFRNFDLNRYRVLDNGEHVIQIMENDIVLFGAEESENLARMAIDKLKPLELESLIKRNEEIVSIETGKSALKVSDPDLQKVIDLNTRITFSGLDEGGACFGALNRLYHLIWVRDGSMSTAHMALAGNPRFLEIWAAFVLANPSTRMNDKGKMIKEWIQIVGTRWAQAEDDGLFYAVYSMYEHFITTGRDDLVRKYMEDMVEAVETAIEENYNSEVKRFTSDTRGESTLPGSPYYGYDPVNGEMNKYISDITTRENPVVQTSTLYHNINMYNVYRMVDVLICAHSELNEKYGRRYNDLAENLGAAIHEQFVREDGTYFSECASFGDGTDKWITFDDDEIGADYWEYAWSVSQGPFHPDIPAALESARMVIQIWPGIKNYGFSPWNTLSRMLKEYGLSTEQYRSLFDEELKDALTLTEKYPMYGALTEHRGGVEGWRPLPFTAGSLILTVVSCILQPLPMGLAVRASDLVEHIDQFCYRTSRIEAEVSGNGDRVRSVSVNGEKLQNSLQIPESLFRPGHNRIEIEKGEPDKGVRLYSSDATLLSVQHCETGVDYSFYSPGNKVIVLENSPGKDSIIVSEKTEFICIEIPETGLTAVDIPVSGSLTLTVKTV